MKIRYKLRNRYNAYKSSDKKYSRSDSVDFSFDEFLYRISIERCVYCDEKENLGLDRIDNSKGHGKVNTVIACPRCNYMRNIRLCLHGKCYISPFSHEEFKLVGKVLHEIDKDRICSKK